jgi:polyisoprenoid-binding protein YceI
MKRLALFISILFGFLAKSQGQVYMADSCRVHFFSSTSMDDIEADNTLCKPLMSTATGDIQISITIQDFVFETRLMGEHFKERYMENAKYPHAAFTGKVNEKVDYTKDDINHVTVTGTMDMHGVKKPITIPGTITIKKGVLFLYAKFDVKMADYNIANPSMLGNDLTDHVAITFTSTMKPYKIN